MEKELTMIFDYLDKIGAKLGIGANLLWPYIMKQQYTQGIVSLVIILVFGCLCLYFWSLYSKLPERHNSSWEDITYFKFHRFWISGVVAAISLIYFIFAGFYQIYNTEYMAFRKLVELVKY